MGASKAVRQAARSPLLSSEPSFCFPANTRLGLAEKQGKDLGYHEVI